MKFEAGKEYKTRDGSVAHVLVDWNVMGVSSEYALEGYVVDNSGAKTRISWHLSGRYYITAHPEHAWDLMPHVIVLNRYVFAVFIGDNYDGVDSVYTRVDLADAETVRGQLIKDGRRVSEVVAVNFTEDSAKEQENENIGRAESRFCRR